MIELEWNKYDRTDAKTWPTVKATYLVTIRKRLVDAEGKQVWHTEVIPDNWTVLSGFMFFDDEITSWMKFPPPDMRE